MDGGRRIFWYGGPGGGACREDDALGSGWKAVPPLGFLVRLALSGDDGTRKPRGGTAFRPLPSASSSRHAPRPGPPSQNLRLPPSTASSTQGMRWLYKPIAPLPTQGTIFTYQPPSARPSSKGTSWPSPILMHRRDFCPSSPLHLPQDQRTPSRGQ